MPRNIPSICYLYCISIALFLLTSQNAVAEKTGNNRIGIEITTHLGDKQTFKQGDVIAFLVSLDKAAHLLMIYQDAEQNLVQIIPNRYRQQDKYEAGLFIAVPDRNEPFEFVVNPPFGQEKIWVFASSQAFPQLESEELSNGLRQLKQGLTEILTVIRPKNQNIPFGEASTIITTEAN